MPRVLTLAILSDIHFACAAEQARGDDYEIQVVSQPVLRWLLRMYRHFIWLRHPLRNNRLLDVFLERVTTADCVVANGDYSCDSAFVGVSDDAACESVKECLGRLRHRFGAHFYATIGDHELGKFSFVGAQGGMRLASYHRAREELNLAPFWQMELGRYLLIGITSSLVALPTFEPETLPEERPDWWRLREEHLSEIRKAFGAVRSEQRILLFCHDPTALPYLWREEMVRNRLSQVEQTVIGHLHSKLIFYKSRVLAGMPAIGFMGNSVRRMSTALREARHWKPFRVRLCPSLSGVELLKDGGFYTVELDPDASRPAVFHWHGIPR